MRALNAGARVPIDEPSTSAIAAPVAAAPLPASSSAPPPPAARDAAAAGDPLEQQLRGMLRAHAAAAAGPGAPVTLHAAEEDIILRELEMTELLLANTAPDAAPGGGRAGLLRRALTVTTLAAAGSPFRTFQMLKRHPGLLRTDPRELADRVLTLKLLLPTCDVSDLIYQKPSLLLMEDLAEQVVAASKQMQALMPGTQWQAKLGSGGTAFMSFCSILGSGGGGLKGGSGRGGGSGGTSRGQASSSSGGSSRPGRGSGGGGGGAG